MYCTCYIYRRRDNPLYETTSAAKKSRDSDHVTSSAVCPTRCLLILTVINIVLATAAVVMATIAITMPFAGTWRAIY